jgi:hypothetical protein
MQDAASVHTAAATVVNVLPGWPGSPDLSPIEDLWAIPKRQVEELGPETKEGLIDVIITAWENIEMSLVNNLVDSMLERLEEVMRNEVGCISC